MPVAPGPSLNFLHQSPSILPFVRHNLVSKPGPFLFFPPLSRCPPAHTCTFPFPSANNFQIWKRIVGAGWEKKRQCGLTPYLLLSAAACTCNKLRAQIGFTVDFECLWAAGGRERRGNLVGEISPGNRAGGWSRVNKLREQPDTSKDPVTQCHNFSPHSKQECLEGICV